MEALPLPRNWRNYVIHLHLSSPPCICTLTHRQECFNEGQTHLSPHYQAKYVNDSWKHRRVGVCVWPHACQFALWLKEENWVTAFSREIVENFRTARVMYLLWATEKKAAHRIVGVYHANSTLFIPSTYEDTEKLNFILVDGEKAKSFWNMC